MSVRALTTITNDVRKPKQVGKTPTLRVKTFHKILKKKPQDAPENLGANQHNQWLMAVERAAWRRGLVSSSSSTSSSTSEDDDVTRKEMFSRIRARLNQFDSESDCTSSEDDTMNYGGGPGIRMRKMRRIQQMKQMSSSDLKSAENDDEVFTAHMRTALSVRSLPQGGAVDRLQEVGVVPEHSQLKLVVCGTSKKLTVTFLGLKSFKQVCKVSGVPNQVYLKISLAPDTESRIRHRTKAERVDDDVTTLHDTFSFDINHRDASKRLLISAWSKTLDSERSVFIGCMSFGIRNIINNQEIIQGWYYFLRENLGRRKHLKVKLLSSTEAAKRHRTPRQHTQSRDSGSGSNCGNQIRSQTSRRRFSNRSGSSDSSLASGYAKTCVYDRCSCSCCTVDEVDRERRRLSKINKRRRVSGGVSTPGVVYYDLGERIPNQGGSPIVTSSVSRRSIGQAVEKRSCDVTGGTMQKAGTKTPCGRRNLQRKNYSSNDLLLSRISYCADPDKITEDDDVFVGKGELKEASLHRMETRSARIVSPTSLQGCKKGLMVDELKKPSDSVSKLRHLRVRNVQPIKFEFDSEAQPSSPDSDDRGYHSDTGVSTSSTTSEESSPSQQSSTDSDYVYLPGDVKEEACHNAPVDGCNVINDLIKTCDGFVDPNDVITKDVEEKSKSGKFFSIKTWLHRRAGDVDGQHRPVVTLKASQSQRRCEIEANKLRRTASLRKPKRNACDNCFGNVQNLSELLEKKGGLAAFRVFLQREFSEENIDFWVDCQNFKLTKPSKARKVALKIYERYVATGSPNEINVDGHIRDETKQKLNDVSPDTFEAAQIRIFKLMERDSFRRFLVSDLAHKCKA
uniref:Uncharacterized protein LOC100184048 n=1 Tax=Phallusia mammillata TaxID=59560 RepID=A0A6F9DHE8_9ASCI|nr:uncharacterized protein LOC100184048 [Phallusia mammillata]